MAKHRAVIVGAGRIGAAFRWHDDQYSHAASYLALKDRVELIGFVEPDQERAEAAAIKWKVPALKSIDAFQDFDIVSVCTQPEDQSSAFASMNQTTKWGYEASVLVSIETTLKDIKGIWCEKPFVTKLIGKWPPVQVNYQRRGDPYHRKIAEHAGEYADLIVYGKDNETTRCHFRDLSRWWKVPLDYRVHDGPCAYLLRMAMQTGPVWSAENTAWFDGGVGGVDSAAAFKAMLGNLLDHIDHGTELWSPPYVE